MFTLVWVCFAGLAAAITIAPTADVAGLSQLLGTGAAILALVLVTLSVAHAQSSGLKPRPAVVAVVVLGIAQGVAADSLGSGDHTDLWGVAGRVFVLVGMAVALAWVAGQFQHGVRRQRVESHASLTASRIERARRQAHQTVQSVHRHDVRSMLFVIDGAGRTLAEPSLSADQRASFGEMHSEGVERLGALMDVRSEEIQPFAVDGVARAVVHAERKAGCQITADLPAGMSALGRAADVAAVLRTLVALAGRSAPAVVVRGEVTEAAIVVRVEPASGDTADSGPLPLLIGIWKAVSTDLSKPFRQNDEQSVDLYVAARLLADQGADLWSTVERDRFAVRLPVPAEPTAQEGA